MPLIAPISLSSLSNTSITRAITLLIGIAPLLLAAESLAQVKSRVFVISSFHDGGRKITQISKSFDGTLSDYMKRRDQLTIVDTTKRKSSSGDDTALLRAEDFKVRAVTLFESGNYEEAHKLLTLSIKGFQREVSAIRSMESVFQALYYMAATCLELEYDADAKDYMRQLIAIAPKLEKLPESLPKRVRKIYRKERKRLLRKSKGAISITSQPAGGQVIVNGELSCASPCEVKDLVRGKHYIQLSMADQRTVGQIVEVKSKRVTPVSFDLNASQSPSEAAPIVSKELQAKLYQKLSKGEVDGVLREQLDDIAQHQSSDYVTFTFLALLNRKAQVFAFVYQVSSKVVIALKPASFRLNFAATRVAAKRTAKSVEKAIKRFPEDQNIAGSYAPIPELLQQIAEGATQRPSIAANLPSVAPTVTPSTVTPPTETSSTGTSGAPPLATTPTPPAPPSITPPPAVTPDAEPVVVARPPAPAQPDLLPPPASVSGDLTSPRSRSLTSSPWFWTGVGVVVIGGAITTGYLLIDGSGDQQRFQSRVVW